MLEITKEERFKLHPYTLTTHELRFNEKLQSSRSLERFFFFVSLA
jgi:hypothetical protein